MSNEGSSSVGRGVDKTGGGFPRKRFTHVAAASNNRTDGRMTAEDAKTVYYDTLKDWGFSSSSEEVRSAVLGQIAELLRQGTSYERDFAKVSFVYEGVTCSLSSLRYRASLKDQTENPVRVWARSYEKGELAVRVYDMLIDPGNQSIREMAALDYGCSLDMVHVAFDFADALPQYPGMSLSQTERLFIKVATSAKVRSSRSMFIASNDGNSAGQMSANVAEGKGAPGSAVSMTAHNAPVRNAGYEGRAGFAGMR